MSVIPLEALPIDELRQRSSTKWRRYPADVLPLFVAETDFALAPAISRALFRAVELGDTGYTPPEPGIRNAFVDFAQRRYGWSIDPAGVRWTCDVIMGVVELLRVVTQPGDRVIVTPPVYPPFYDTIVEAGAEVERVPLLHTDAGWELDLPGIETALAAGARCVLLCNPHNPTGTAHSKASLAALADLADTFGVAVISDEIHAPLVQPSVTFTPFLEASAVAARVGYVVTSASKAFNTAGLKCALMVASNPATISVVQSLPDEVEWRTGLFGAIAAVAAFAPESDEWLDSLLARLDENARLLAVLLAEHVPEAKYEIPDAGFLGWVDLTAFGWGANPAERILQEAKVALNPGPDFGEQGTGHVRINFGCSPDVLRDAVERIGVITRS
ncbi:aminotransferase class I/II-fold pyridoxal phosphate-dependent enzyme [Microbacterium sp. NPDC076911]|uniref:MalY/PatB family protein n=1 Tax=Microbacterium sp. NPDC076911 TaxID=3154958 RepID=UPI003447F2FC